MKPSTEQWRIPVGLQLIPAGILGFGMIVCKESPRFLAKRGRYDEALKNLIWVRAEDSVEVRAE